MKFITALLVGFIIFMAYTTNIYLGIVISVFFLLYGMYKYLPTIYRIKGKRAFAVADYKLAKELFGKMMKTGRATNDMKLEYSYILLRTGDVEEAEQVANNTLCGNVKPDFRGRAVIQRCMCYYKNGNFAEALADATELYDDGYRSITLYGLLGYFKILQSPTSEETYNFCREAYDYADDDRDICDNMLICHYNRGEYTEAKEISDSVLEKNPKFVEAWYHGAMLDEKLGNYTDGLEKIKKIDDCNRSFMTTISEREVTELKEKIERKLKG